MSVDHCDRLLAEALEEKGYPESVLAKARAGHWSDFKTDLPFPKMDLCEMLHADGHDDLRRKVMDGDFDG